MTTSLEGIGVEAARLEINPRISIVYPNGGLLMILSTLVRRTPRFRRGGRAQTLFIFAEPAAHRRLQPVVGPRRQRQPDSTSTADHAAPYAATSAAGEMYNLAHGLPVTHGPEL